MSFFLYSSVAKRYAQSRPYLHPDVMKRIRAFIGDRVPFGLALDVGCGTGQSSGALRSLASEVTGIDVSIDMLQRATHVDGVRYCGALAEVLPFRAATFDLMTVGLAFHWFRREEFLSEARRTLLKGGWLLIYNNWITGEMDDDGSFANWFAVAYLRRFPSPPRDRRPLTREYVQKKGFTLVDEEEFSQHVSMTAEQLVAYLLTQTNIIAAVERGGQSLGTVSEWVGGSVRELFGDDPSRAVKFYNRIWYLQVSDRK